MTSGARACNLDELVELINQALDEVEDLRVAIEYDEEFNGESSLIVEPVSAGLSRLLTAINDDSYRIGEGDWLRRFLEPLRDHDHRAVPFWPLLNLILNTHEEGFQKADD